MFKFLKLRWIFINENQQQMSDSYFLEDVYSILFYIKHGDHEWCLDSDL